MSTRTPPALTSDSNLRVIDLELAQGYCWRDSFPASSPGQHHSQRGLFASTPGTVPRSAEDELRGAVFDKDGSSSHPFTQGSVASVRLKGGNAGRVPLGRTQTGRPPSACLCGLLRLPIEGLGYSGRGGLLRHVLTTRDGPRPRKRIVPSGVVPHCSSVHSLLRRSLHRETATPVHSLHWCGLHLAALGSAALLSGHFGLLRPRVDNTRLLRSTAEWVSLL